MKSAIKDAGVKSPLQVMGNVGEAMTTIAGVCSDDNEFRNFWRVISHDKEICTNMVEYVQDQIRGRVSQVKSLGTLAVKEFFTTGELFKMGDYGEPFQSLERLYGDRKIIQGRYTFTLVPVQKNECPHNVKKRIEAMGMKIANAAHLMYAADFFFDRFPDVTFSVDVTQPGDRIPFIQRKKENKMEIHVSNARQKMLEGSMVLAVVRTALL